MRMFGDRYFIEIQNNGLEMQRQALELSVALAKRMGLPFVATSDAHYVSREDAVAQDVLLCINTGKFRTDTNRMRMEGDQFFLRSPRGNVRGVSGLGRCRRPQPADCRRRQHRSWNWASGIFPRSRRRRKRRPAAYLRELCEAGLRERYANDPRRWQNNDPQSGELGDDVRQRLERELDVIEKLGFCDYFLIVWDFVRYATRAKHSLHGPWIGRRLARLLCAADQPRLSAAVRICCSSGSWTKIAAKRRISISTSAKIAAAK